MKRLRFAAPLLLGLALGGCAEGGGSTPETRAEASASAPVDTTLLAFLSAARSAHHRADISERNKDLEGAIRALDELLLAQRPGEGGSPPEVAEVLADTRARAADLRSAVGIFDRAIDDVNEGLRLAQEPSYFRGHLFEVRGLVLERKAALARRNGDEAAAKADEEQALQAFDEAIQIQMIVVQRSLGDGPTP